MKRTIKLHLNSLSLPLPHHCRETKEAGKLSDKCAERVFEAEVDAANDFKLDPQLNEVCSADATKLCSDVQPGEGRVQICLVSMHFSPVLLRRV